MIYLGYYSCHIAPFKVSIDAWKWLVNEEPLHSINYREDVKVLALKV